MTLRPVDYINTQANNGNIGMDKDNIASAEACKILCGGLF